MTTRISRRAMACALLATTSLSLPTLATAETPAPRYVDTLDDHGVDLVNGLPFLTIEEGGIGSGRSRMPLQRIWSEGAGFLDNWSGGLYNVTANNVTKKYLQFAGISDTFSGSGTTWTSDKADGSTLTYDDINLLWNYTARDGTKIVFLDTTGEKTFNCPGAGGRTCKPPVSITLPDGLAFYPTWETADICVFFNGDPCGKEYIYNRLSGVGSSGGYSVNFTYQSNTATAGMLSTDPWFKRATATFDNLANHPSPVPTITYAYPNASEIDVTDPAGRMWVFTTDASGRLMGVKRPGSASNNLSYGYGADGTVNSSTKDGVTVTYSRSLVGTTGTETRTDPLGHQRVVVSDTNTGRPSSDKDENLHTTSYAYDANSRLTQITAPEGNNVVYTLDARGNVTDTTLNPKAGSGLSAILTHAGFDTTCTNIVKCNKPNWTKDGKGNQTDYVYDPTHGGVTSITQPAPTVGGVRPQTRYGYTQVTGPTSDLVYMLTSVSACMTLASCTNGADEAKVTAAYNSNLLPSSVTRKNGTGTLTSTSTPTYDARGNMLTLDGPLTGTSDTTAYKYDNADQLTGVISPDPDGAGTMLNRAIRLTYRPDGQVSKEELGTTTGQTDANFNAMVVKETVDVTFDTNNRPTQQKLSSGATAYALTQTSYDTLGRVDCTATRMNTAVYGSLPASACTLSTQGSFGPDPISQNVYDAASQVTDLKVGVGTSDAATERHLTYNANGTLATLLDGENNLTTYEYDGFDRLAKIRYPLPTKGSNASSTTDYEQLLNYDANGNPASRRLRDGTSIAFTYDNLDRVTLKNLPGTEPDVTYGYNNLGRLTSASQTGNNLTFGWDALGRKTSEAGPQGTTTFGYDAADERTSITYPSTTALTINYAYLKTGELDTIKQGSTVLADYAYDNLGNRTGVAFANGASQAFTYDAVSRLSSLTNDLSGTANDLTVSSIGYNPAGQITSLTRSNDAYAFSLISGTTATTSNGLNQQATVGGSTVGWDTKGNLTSDPTSAKTYGYSSENLLTSASGGITLGYDPALRLYSIGTTTRFLYDGVDAIAEYNGTNALQRRFVFDPTSGQPVLWYEGTGTALTNVRYLSQDERGSVISVSDSSAASLGLNTYDEYGKPGASNLGRFQYTGQKWVPEAGLYDYKARDYLPHLGIFAQTDPIGQVDDPNLYAYVGDEPINRIDPQGLYTVCKDVSIDVGQDAPNWTLRCYDNGIELGGQPRPEIGNGNDRAGGGGEIVIVGHRRPKSGSNRPSRQCVAAKGFQGTIERALGWGAKISDDAATLAALTGQEELAGPLETLSWVLTAGKAGSQALRHDTLGAASTLESAAASSLIGRANKILPIGGKAQARFNTKLSSTLGWATGRGLDTAFSCE